LTNTRDVSKPSPQFALVTITHRPAARAANLRMHVEVTTRDITRPRTHLAATSAASVRAPKPSYDFAGGEVAMSEEVRGGSQ